MVRLWHIIAILLFIFSTITHAVPRTYWVDASCSNRPGWSEFIDETLTMARTAAGRLESTSDSDFANVFKRIFKVDKTDATLHQALGRKDTAYNLVHDMLAEIGRESTQTQDRLASDVRIYCNNGGARWVDTTNKKGKQKKMDWDNFMEIRGHSGCADTKIFAFTEIRRPVIPADKPSQNSLRSTIDICDTEFATQSKSTANFGTSKNPSKLSDVPITKDLTQLPDGVQDLRRLVSMCLLHEWTHTQYYDAVDYGYGWPKIMALDAEKSLGNADSYAYLGVFALLADRQAPKGKPGSGYTLARPWTNPDSKGGKEAESDAAKGLLKLERQLTKLILSAMREMNATFFG